MKKDMKKFKKENLKASGVVFNEDEHSYWLDGRQLSGITGVIRRHVFPDKYKNVPQTVLDRRADFGHIFHSEMELWINAGIEGSSSTFGVFMENFIGIKFAASEYIVTDGTHFASPIDAIDEDGVIYDFKTSTAKDTEYWRWQLGVYCHLFRIQNGFSPSGCRVLWINKDGMHDLVDIEPVSEDRVVALLDAERSGLPFVDPAEETAAAIIPDERSAALAAIEREIVRRETDLKKMQADRDMMKAAILEAMISAGVKSIDTDALKLTVKDSYTRTSVDSKALKENYPEAYNECLKETTVKASLTITLKE